MDRQTITLTKLPASVCKLAYYEPVGALTRLKLESPVNLSAITNLIALDPAIVAEVLVAANSPVYGFAAKVYTVQDAIMVLGWGQTQRVVRAALEADVSPKLSTRRLIERSWAHSLVSACVASELAPSFDLSEDRAFTLVLMHDIGRLGMLSTAPDVCVELADREYADSIEVLEAENRQLRMDHCRAGLWLARAWGLPAAFCEIAAGHHGLVPEIGRTPVVLAGLACRLAHVGGFTVEGRTPPTLEQALSIVEKSLASEVRRCWDQIQSRSHERLLQLTSSLCDLSAIRHGCAQESGRFT